MGAPDRIHLPATPASEASLSLPSGFLFLFLFSAVSSYAQENDLLKLPDGVREKDFVQEHAELLDAPESICLAMLANPNPNDIQNPGGNFVGQVQYCLAKYFPTQDGNCRSTTRKFNSLTRRNPELRQSLIAQHVKDHRSSRSRRDGK